MAAQCDHLIASAIESHIQLHVVPECTGAYAGLAGPFILATGTDFEAAHLDNPLQAQVIDQHAGVDKLLRRWEAIRGEALPRTQTIKLIEEAGTKWQT